MLELLKDYDMSFLYRPGMTNVGADALEYQSRFYFSTVCEKQLEIILGAHSSKCLIHPGFINMYRNLREVYLLNRMKKGIAEVVAMCMKCQHVKVKN